MHGLTPDSEGIEQVYGGGDYQGEEAATGKRGNARVDCRHTGMLGLMENGF